MRDLNRVKFMGDGRVYRERLVKDRHKWRIRKEYGQIVNCQNCGGTCFVSDVQIKRGCGKFCSNKCHLQGKFNPNWKGGKWNHTDGYILQWYPEHHFANTRGYVSEHKLVIEKFIGRYLKREEHVHHINKIKNDNRPENLMAFKNESVHQSFEQGGKINPEEIIFDGRVLNETKRCDLG